MRRSMHLGLTGLAAVSASGVTRGQRQLLQEITRFCAEAEPRA